MNNTGHSQRCGNTEQRELGAAGSANGVTTQENGSAVPCRVRHIRLGPTGSRKWVPIPVKQSDARKTLHDTESFPPCNSPALEAADVPAGDG